MMPATIGADTEVPVWPSVQRCLRSVVTWGGRSCSPQNAPSTGTNPSTTPRFAWDAARAELSLLVPNPCHDSNGIRVHRAPKMGCRYIWCMRIHPCDYIFLCSKVQKLSEGGKKSIWLWFSWRKRWMEQCKLVWVHVEPGAGLSHANTPGVP